MAVPITALNRSTRKIYAQAACKMLVPLGLGHLGTLGREPDDLLEPFRGHGISLQEAAAAEYRMAAPECNHLGGEFQKPLLLLIEPPVEPECLVVLAVRVVVAALGMAELIAGEHHGH